MQNLKKNVEANILFIAIPLFLLVRVLILCLLHPYYYTLGGGEEPYTAAVGVELLKGPIFPLFEYLISDYQGGTLVVAAIAAPLFKFLGTSTFISKLPALILFAGTLFLWIKILKKYFNNSITYYFSTLFIFSSPSFTQFSHTVLGYHSESIFFSTLAFFIFVKIILDKNNSWILHASLGFLSGFSLWFAYIYSFTLVSILITWFLYDKKFIFRKSFLIFCIAFIIGFFPWILFNFQNHFSGLQIYGESLWGHFSWGHLSSAFTSHRSNAFYHLFYSFAQPFWGFSKSIALSTALSYSLLYFMPVLLGLLILASKRFKIQKESFPFSFFFIYSVLFLFAIQISDFDGERYFIPFHTFLFFFTAYGLTKIESPFKNIKLFKLSFLSILIVLFVLNHAPTLSAKYVGKIFATKGYAYQWIDTNLCSDYKQCIEKYPLVEQKLKKEDHYEFSTELAAHTAWFLLENNSLLETIKLGKTMPITFQTFFFYFLGREIMERSEATKKSIRTISPFTQDKQIHSLMLKGIYDKAVGFHRDEKDLETLNLKEENPAYWRYIGEIFAGNFNLEKESIESIWRNIERFMSKIDVKHHAFFAQGVGRTFYDTWAARTLSPIYNPGLLQAIPKAYQKSVFQGIGMEMADREFAWQIAQKDWYFEKFTKDLEFTNIEAIRQGRESVQEFFYI